MTDPLAVAARVDAHHHFWDLSSGRYDWPTEAESPIFRSFGPERLLFGSDWPVCRLVSSYGDVVRGTEQLIGGLSSGEQARIMGGTATEAYGLGRSAAPTGSA
jgi:predicted TIM-barrel fold metal-dependent hydrolase